MKRLASLQSVLAEAVGTGVFARVATPDMYHLPLHAEEYLAIQGAVLKRKQEFAAGRAAARSALAEMGVDHCSIPSRVDRAPIWPVGTVGSISHCNTACAAIVSRIQDNLSLGIDLEETDSLPSDVYRLVFSKEEMEALAVWDTAFGCSPAKIGFCAKEAFYKSYFFVRSQFLDFQDVGVVFQKPLNRNQGRFSVTVKDWAKRLQLSDLQFLGKWFVHEGVICTLVFCRAKRLTRDGFAKLCL